MYKRSSKCVRDLKYAEALLQSPAKLPLSNMYMLSSMYKRSSRVLQALCLTYAQVLLQSPAIFIISNMYRRSSKYAHDLKYAQGLLQSPAESITMHNAQP